MKQNKNRMRKKSYTGKDTLPAKAAVSEHAVTQRLLRDIRRFIHEARAHISYAANAGLVALYWRVGDHIRREVLLEQRAEYGKGIVHALSKQLLLEYGRGFSRRNLFNMIRFVEVFPNPEIVQTLSAQLGWSHFMEIIYLKDSLERDFYAEMCRLERWSVRTLRAKIQGMLYERTAISKKPDQLIKKELATLREADKITPDLVFRDPYLLDFLGLKDTYSESDLEAAILRELERFIIELGSDFAFLARQKRITVDNTDYYLDLLFFHRRLRRLVAIDLKLGRFQAADKGQMELYLRWLEQHEQQPGEQSPVGLILCAGKSEEHVELLQLERSGIRVAEYLTELPPRDVLERKLREAIQLARQQLAARTEASAMRARRRKSAKNKGETDAENRLG
jgi:predicted nuclease of restriction endonuclease-like (RecB) superfamily